MELEANISMAKHCHGNAIFETVMDIFQSYALKFINISRAFLFAD